MAGVTMKPSLAIRPEVVITPDVRWTPRRKEEIARYVEKLEEYATGLEHQVRLFLFERDTGIDPAAPPHEVPCPLCRASAGEPCRDRSRPVAGGRYPGLPGAWPMGSMMVAPHPERQEHWMKNPAYRVKFTKEKLW